MAHCKLGWRKRWALGIFADLYREKVAEHRLDTLFWECTLRCNLHCRHCGSDCRADALQPDMPAEDFLRVIDEEVTPHVKPQQVLVILSGGEVLMRPDLTAIGRALSERGYPWGMVTNGLALSEERLNELIDAGLKALTISLDGFELIHNRMRGHQESFRRAVEAIQAAKRHPELAFDVVSCITPPMVGQLEQLGEWLYEQGVTDWRLFSIFPMGRAKVNTDLALSGEELRTMLDYIARQRRAGEGIRPSYACEGFLGGYEAEVRDHFYQCAAGVSVASIRVDGAISGCTSVRADYSQGNIYHDRFWEVWQHKFAPFRDRSWMKKGACGSCKMFRFCQGGGMHLRDEQGELLYCHYQKLNETNN